MEAEGDEIVMPRLLAEFQKRYEFGWSKYNRPLMTFDGRNTLWDSLEEALDLSVYIMKAIMEEEVRTGRRSGKPYHCPGCTCDNP